MTHNRIQVAVGMFIAIAAIGASAMACGDDEASLDPRERTFYMEAIEPKGSASVDQEPFPAESLPEGGGYALKNPNDEGKWEVETYVWSAEQIIVTEGDTVNLEILGINGSRHDASIEGYVDSFAVERGKLTKLSFEAAEAGVFAIACRTHPPSMTAELVVVPKD